LICEHAQDVRRDVDCAIDIANVAYVKYRPRVILPRYSDRGGLDIESDYFPPTHHLEVVRGAAPSASCVDYDRIGLLFYLPHGKFNGLFFACVGIIAITDQGKHPHSLKRVH
jgi:hypothetical protein